MSFIMIDFDDFKKINDTLGHFTGDKILIKAATLIKKTIRGSDLLFRFGGDEFLIYLPNTSCDKSSYMLQRLLSAVDGWNKDNSNTYGCELSFSMGYSSCEKSRDIPEALKEADAKMYQNKMGKRNNALTD